MGWADSLTYYETVGWHGVMERESGSPLPDLFPSTAGGVYPMYHIFADVGEFAGGEVLSVSAQSPLDAIALRRDHQLRLIVINYGEQPQKFMLKGLTGRFLYKSLDETSATLAIASPEAFRREIGKQIEISEAGIQLVLLPYAIIRLDQLTP